MYNMGEISADKDALFWFVIYRVGTPGFFGKCRKNKKVLEWPPGFFGKWRKNEKVLEWSKADFFAAQNWLWDQNNIIPVPKS